MRNATDSPVEEDIREIKLSHPPLEELVIEMWIGGATPWEIACETGQEAKTIFRVLKKAQREMIEDGGIDHGKRNDS